MWVSAFVIVTLLSAIPPRNVRSQGDGVHLRFGNFNTAPPGRFPYMCSLRFNSDRSKHACGGILVDPSWVLTAAHCVDPTSFRSTGRLPIVYCGIHDIEDDSEDLVFGTVEGILHEDWDGNAAAGNDIAMLKLDKEAAVTVPRLNAPSSRPVQGRPLDGLGWGKTRDGRRATELQLAENLNTISRTTCNARWNGTLSVERVLCAGIGENDACDGDSGGPLLYADSPEGSVKKGNPRYDLIVGIVSFGDEACGNSTKPGVYTDVGYYQEWILRIIKGRSSTSTGSTQQPPVEPCPTAPKLKVVVAAIEHDDATTVRAALDCGLDPGSVYNNATSSLLLGDTLLQWAARFDSPHSAKVLLEFAAEIEERTFLNRTPLHYCAFYGSPSAAKVLLDHGADIEAQGLFGERPLDLAAWRGHPEVVKVLVSNGADVNAVDNGGKTSLHTASQYGHPDIVKILLDAGASKTVEDNKGRKAIDVICSLNTAKCSNSTRSDIEALLAPSVRGLLTNPFLFGSG